MTPHNEAQKGDIAKIVIMPGDPLRAKMIAETYLENPILINQIRGMYGYTGTYKGKKITVMGSGMGMPSMGIYSYELFKFYDVDTIIRVGSMGAYTKDLNLYDVVLEKEVFTESTYGKMQNKDLETTLYATKEINDTIKKVARQKQIKIQEGKVYCSDVFYYENFDLEKYQKQNLLGVEMESFALFHNAKVLGKKATCILTVSDNIVTNEETTAVERQKAFLNMIELALETCLYL